MPAAREAGIRLKNRSRVDTAGCGVWKCEWRIRQQLFRRRGQGEPERGRGTLG